MRSPAKAQLSTLDANITSTWCRDHLVKRRPEVLEVNVSCTTRAMRWLSFTSVFVVAPPVIMLVRFKHDSAWLALAALISPSMLQHAAHSCFGTSCEKMSDWGPISHAASQRAL